MVDRRTLLKSGLAATAVGASGILGTGVAHAIPSPRIYTCTEWSARPPAAPITVENHRPTYIVVHHTVDPGNVDDYSKAHAFWAARAIQNFHMDTRGWIDTGQQFTNSRGGYVMEGRHRSLEVLRGGTKHVQGANVGNHNSECIGIENEGLYSTEDVPGALWNSLVQLVAYMAQQYAIDPEFIKGHRDFNSTECPGQVLYDRLPELRDEVSRLLGYAARRSATTEWPLLKPGATGQRVLVAQRLLRDKGYNVPTDGVFGPSTKDAVRSFAAARGVPSATCYASANTDESGFLGADLWPLLTTDPHALKAQLATSR
ncbi:Putative peptidoglycan binding domain-containing protein [Amycolatopsis xylanica]|uniref:Putative peptidoglycan binding domain-containing protein n=1 Tax=Amycolatopsis xylanica TaxID=589385 RepID=A0A1H2Z1Y9_9PSEU|nr:N-acetylmuramoyl-L-alanine amidase [Amycolatopsis xylanica]SDX10809.1 Putative peptidoglycan binding domain-containing protein [Amycolatopsis xylanica]